METELGSIFLRVDLESRSVEIKNEFRKEQKGEQIEGYAQVAR